MPQLDELLVGHTLDRVRALLDGREDVGLVLTDPEGRILWANAAHPRTRLQLDEADYLGKYAGAFFHPDDQLEFDTTHRRAIETNQTIGYVVRVADPDGGWTPRRIVKWAEATPSGGRVVISIGVPISAPDLSGFEGPEESGGH